MGASASVLMATMQPASFMPATCWDAPEMPPEIEQMRNEKRTGELILVAAERILTGAEGQFGDVTIGLAILRDLGMEDVLRRTALELILLERRG